ncbi:toll/interleukin-1 receptor domain-containing protein [Mycolicibacterium aichiense]|uniref:toll/interleukin-1 receptor domain-containing protein n=1 Tax=Mycolicibacterium aichiense TaxID=1799 RepID=UPI003D67766B
MADQPPAGAPKLLSKSERLDLVFALTEHIQSTSEDRPWDRTKLILETFGFRTDSPTLEEDLNSGTDDELLELAEHFRVPPPGSTIDTGRPTPRPVQLAAAIAEPLFIFGSHLSTHKAFVGEVGRELAAYGINLFVAHDTITHDAVWEDEIRAALDRADAGLVFVHDGLRDSNWCDQEIGWLQGRHVPVMALRFDCTPYGFFARYQAQPVPPNATARQIAEMTVDRVAAKPELAGGFAASLVSVMATTRDFDDTRARWRYLRDLNCLDAGLCAQLLNAAKTHNQIYWASSTSAGDEGQSISRLIIAFIRRQPGGSAVAPDVDAYEKYLDERDASGVSFYTAHTPPAATVNL